MKIEKIMLLRPEIEVELRKPFFGWCYFILYIFRFVKVFRLKYRIDICSKLLKDAGHVYFRTAWFICIPKFQIKKVFK